MKSCIVKLIVCLVVLTCAWSVSGSVYAGGKTSEPVASGSPPAPGTYDVGGTAFSINIEFGYIIVQTNKGCYQAIYPDAHSAIIKNGVPASVMDIHVGDRIRSSNSLSTGTAISIDVRS